MNSFLVYLYDNELEDEVVTLCNNKEDLASLLLNLSDKYEIIGNIEVINAELEINWRVFCKPLDDFKH